MLAEEVKLRPMTELRIRAHVNKALAQAVTLGLYTQVQPDPTGQYYVVPSTTRGGLDHTVERGKPWACTCEAGQFLPYCVHRAAVQLHLWVDEGLEVEVDRIGQVYVVERRLAGPLAYDPFGYEALIQDTPPVASYEQEAPHLAPDEGGAGGAGTDGWRVVTTYDTAPRPVRRKTALDRD